jgi:hypothetical protein
MKEKDIQTMQTDFVLQTKKENKVSKKKEKGKERIGERYLIASGVMKKGNEEIVTTKGTIPTIRDKPTHKIPIKPMEKGMAKDSKEKAKEKASHVTEIERKTPTKGIIKTRRKSR